MPLQQRLDFFINIQFSNYHIHSESGSHFYCFIYMRQYSVILAVLPGQFIFNLTIFTLRQPAYATAVHRGTAFTSG